MFYYYDAPTHRDHIKWHTHPHSHYCVCKAWLQKTGENGADAPAQANTDEVDTNQIDAIATDATSTLISEYGSQQSLNALLETVINLVTDNDVPRDHIAKVINNISSIK